MALTRKTSPTLFTVYRIYDGELESADVVRVTRKRWWFRTSAGLAFGCRTGCEPDECTTDPKVAWTEFRDRAIVYRDEEQRFIDAADCALERYVKEGLPK